VVACIICATPTQSTHPSDTAIVGGPGDNPWDRSVPFGFGAAGAAWVFTRSGSVWTQQGGKLVGSGAVGKSAPSVALSADGSHGRRIQ